MAQDMFSPPASPAPVTVQGMLPTPGAGQFREMQSDKPYVPMQRLGFWPQVGKYVEQGTHQSLAKYFGIADKMGFTDALNEDEFNHLKGERPMLYRPGFSRKTWENEIDAHDVGKVMEGLEINGIDSTFAMVVGSVLGGFTDPVNVAGTYLAPMVGAMALGANALSRGAVAHILRTEGPEALVKFLSANPTGYFQQVKRAAIFGAAEGAMEIPADKYLSELTGQRTYTAADAGLNILTGAALNATIAGVDPAVTGTMRAVQKRWSKAFKETNTFAGQIAAKGINDGRPVTVTEVEANVAKMDTYQPSAKRQVERTDGKKAMTPERATPTPQRVNLTVPDVTHASGAPLDFKGDDVSKALYVTAGGNKDVEDQLMRALIDNGTFHADVPSTREALQQAAAEIRTKVEAQSPSDKIKVDGVPTLAHIRDRVIPRVDVPKVETPEAQAAVDHTFRPSSHDLVAGQDYKATQIAAIDNHSNQILKDMEESGAYTPEELQAVNAQANKLASILDAARVCPTR